MVDETWLMKSDDYTNSRAGQDDGWAPQPNESTPQQVRANLAVVMP